MQEFVTIKGIQTFYGRENQTNLYAVLLCYKPWNQCSNFSCNTEVIMELFYILNERAGCRITNSMRLINLIP